MIVQNIKHKALMANKIVKVHGFMHLAKTIPEALFMKRTFYIFGYCLEQSINYDIIQGNYRIHKNDFDFLASYRSRRGNLPLEFYRDQIDNCKHFYILSIYDGKRYEPASICWIYDNRYIHRVLSLRDDEVELNHGYTMTEFRGRGINTALLKIVLKDLKSMGFAKAITIVEESSIVPAKIFKKLEFKELEKKSLRKIFGVTISRRYKTMNTKL